MVRVLIPFILLLSTAAAQAAPPKFTEWESVLSPAHVKRIRNGDWISDVLFDAMDDIRVFKFDDDRFSVQLNLSRDVFDSGTQWNVMDRFDIKGGAPLLSGSSLNWTSPSGFYVGFSAGVHYGLEFANIRPVTKEEFRSMKSPERIQAEIAEQPWYDDFIRGRVRKMGDGADAPPSIAWKDADGRMHERLLPDGPDDHVKWGDLLNMILFPFRLPLKADGLQKLTDGEILSYAGSGAFEFGPQAGISLDPTGIIGAVRAEVSYTVFLRGTHQITILKENSRYARVRVDQVRSRSTTTAIGGSDKPRILDGFILTRLLSSQAKIIPFNLQVSDSVARAFQMAFRYDMENAHAREAYERAVLGSFALSESLALDKDGNPTDFSVTGVSREFVGGSVMNRKAETRKLQLTVLFKKNHRGSLTNVDAELRTPEGLRRGFSSVADDAKEWKALLGRFEKMKHSFGIYLDPDRFEQNSQDPEALELIAQASIDDSHTKSEEMLQYILEMENGVSQFGIFPRPFERDERASRERRKLEEQLGLPAGSFGRSLLWRELRVPRHALDRFQDADEDQRWKLLENVFGTKPGEWRNPLARALYNLLRAPLSLLNVPLYLADVNLREGSILYHAARIEKRWQKLQAETAPKARVEAMGKMFYDTTYSYELTKLLRGIIEGEHVPYAVSGYSSLFGQIRKDGQTQVTFEDIASREQDRIEGRGPPERPTALRVRALQDRLQGLELDLPSDARAINLQILSVERHRTRELLSTLVRAADFPLPQGRISIDLLAEGPDSPWSDACKLPLKSFERGLLFAQVRATQDGLRWSEPLESAIEF